MPGTVGDPRGDGDMGAVECGTARNPSSLRACGACTCARVCLRGRHGRMTIIRVLRPRASSAAVKSRLLSCRLVKERGEGLAFLCCCPHAGAFSLRRHVTPQSALPDEGHHMQTPPRPHSFPSLPFCSMALVLDAPPVLFSIFACVSHRTRWSSSSRGSCSPVRPARSGSTSTSPTPSTSRFRARSAPRRTTSRGKLRLCFELVVSLFFFFFFRRRSSKPLFFFFRSCLAGADEK